MALAMRWRDSNRSLQARTFSRSSSKQRHRRTSRLGLLACSVTAGSLTRPPRFCSASAPKFVKLPSSIAIEGHRRKEWTDATLQDHLVQTPGGRSFDSPIVCD